MYTLVRLNDALDLQNASVKCKWGNKKMPLIHAGVGKPRDKRVDISDPFSIIAYILLSVLTTLNLYRHVTQIGTVEHFRSGISLMNAHALF